MEFILGAVFIKEMNMCAWENSRGSFGCSKFPTTLNRGPIGFGGKKTSPNQNFSRSKTNQDDSESNQDPEAEK